MIDPLDCPHSDRQHGGVQIRWNQGADLTFGQRWNPWCTDIPWVTLAHHPIIYNPKETETATFNVDDFFESLLQATSKAFETKRPNEKVGKRDVLLVFFLCTSCRDYIMGKLNGNAPKVSIRLTLISCFHLLFNSI